MVDVPATRSPAKATAQKVTALGLVAARTTTRTLATLPSVQHQADAHRLRGEIVELADEHRRLVAIAAELRQLGHPFAAHTVIQDARFVAGFVGNRAFSLGYGVVTVACAAERAARELHPFAPHLTMHK